MQEELRRQSVRSEASIAVEDVLTVYGNTPRLSSPASETPGGIRLSSTLFQRGRMCGAYLTRLPPGSQTTRLFKLQWATDSDRIMDGDRP